MKVLVVCGATATGKTKLAVDCALKLDTEIISADSQLVYKGLNIGTAKPTRDETRGIKHHLIDVVEPTEQFSVSDYSKLAEPILKRLISENKTPILCGGTGFYVNSLLYDLSYGSTAADTEIRNRYENILKDKGKDYLFDCLERVDPATAEKLHPNDTKRVIRALEIYELSGIRKSDINDGKKVKYEYVAVAIDYPRDELYERINKRVDDMFSEGLVDEVKNLLSKGIDEKFQCMQAIGYKEVLFGLRNGLNHSTMSDIIKQNTRRYAKRQITFFKKLEGLVWLKPEEATCEFVTGLLNE